MKRTEQLPTGQWLTGSDGVSWFFESGSLSLDFGYTGDYGYGVPAWERLHEPEDLAAWLRGRFPAGDPRVDDAFLAQARRLRSAVAAVARALAATKEPTPADIDVINRIAAAEGVPRLLDGGSWAPAPAGPEAMLATIAQDAVAVFSDVVRVKQCAAADCRLIFFDTSRPGTRRWCSMQRCGNRAKTRAHYARHRE